MAGGDNGGHMKQNRSTWRDWKTWVIAMESLIILACALAAIRNHIQAMQELPLPENNPGYNYMYIHEYPKKMTYVAGIDEALDLTGGMICYTRYPRHSEGCACAPGPSGCSGVQDMAFVEVVSEVDFTKEGVYMIVLEQDMWEHPIQCAFPIEVISPDYVE